MAPLEGITSARVYQVMGVFLVVISLSLGILSLYQGLTRPPDDTFLGIDTDVLTGLWWLSSAVIWAVLYRHIVRQQATIDEERR